MKKNKGTVTPRALMLLASVFLPLVSLAQDGQTEQTISYFSNPLFNTLLVIMIVLLVMIIALGGALKALVGSDLYIEKLRRDNEEKNQSKPNATPLVLIFILMSFSAFSQNAGVKSVNADLIGGLDQFTFYAMLTMIALELIVIGILFDSFKKILGMQKMKAHALTEAKAKTKTIFDKMNYTVEIEQEESIMLDHDYDGIKELDNNLPPWWKYGFYLTIVVAVIYLINYHVTGSSPLQKEEYTISVKKAEAEIAEFMKNSANNVDENTVKMLSGASDLASGKDLFISTCAACHGKGGEGSVGPNLTDDYWLHGGSVKDIFKTIKYGWPDKGMKSWKDDFSPMQIAQLTSFIRTLKGTNPPNPKDKQGELYVETETPSDSTAVKADSLTVKIDSTKITAPEPTK